MADHDHDDHDHHNEPQSFLASPGLAAIGKRAIICIVHRVMASVYDHLLGGQVL
jgi:hypothetical protein